MGCALDEVAFRRDTLFLQGLIEEVCLARRDDGVGRAVHEEHGSAAAADISDQVGGSRIIIADARQIREAVAESTRTVGALPAAKAVQPVASIRPESRSVEMKRLCFIAIPPSSRKFRVSVMFIIRTRTAPVKLVRFSTSFVFGETNGTTCYIIKKTDEIR